MQEPRQLYGLGSLVKKITKPIKKIIKSPIGKAALLIGGAGLAGFGPAAGLRTSGLGNFLFGGATKMLPANVIKGAAVSSPGIFGKAANFFGGLSTGAKLGIGAGVTSLLAASGMGEEEIEETKRDPAKLKIYLRDYFSKLNPNASDAEIEEFVETNVSEYATGGRVGFKEGMNMKMASMDENEREFMRLVEEFMERGFNQQEAIEAAREEFDRKAIATGGRVGYASGFGVTDYAKSMNSGRGPITLNDFIDIYKFAGYDDGTASSLGKKHYKTGMGQDSNTQGFAMGGEVPVRKNKGGIMELDYRETGGFVPVGIKEKADDVPAMLSKNEFVMTADAVRGMGDGSIEKGAQRLYDQMKRLENKVV
jgi:hypothetical protein